MSVYNTGDDAESRNHGGGRPCTILPLSPNTFKTHSYKQLMGMGALLVRAVGTHAVRSGRAGGYQIWTE